MKPIWFEQALCRGMDPSLFVPDFDPDTRQGPAPEAFRVCNGDGTQWAPECPVKAQCLAYGVENKASGCFGGIALYNGKRRRRKKS